MINKLKKEVEKLIDENEYNIVKIKGVRLSRADLETLEFFCNILLKNGNLNGYIVVGEVKEVLEKYNINYKGDENIWSL